MRFSSNVNAKNETITLPPYLHYYIESIRNYYIVPPPSICIVAHFFAFIIKLLFKTTTKMLKCFYDLPVFFSNVSASDWALSSGGDEGCRSGCGSRLEPDCSWKECDLTVGCPFLSPSKSLNPDPGTPSVSPVLCFPLC